MNWWLPDAVSTSWSTARVIPTYRSRRLAAIRSGGWSSRKAHSTTLGNSRPFALWMVEINTLSRCDPTCALPNRFPGSVGQYHGTLAASNAVVILSIQLNPPPPANRDP